MKKIIALLVCALLALLPALAENVPENPFGSLPDEHNDAESPRGNADAREGLDLDILGQSVHLAFDPTPEYSSIQGGMVQASYYAYGADGVTLYELYISFPATAKPGMVITPQYEAITNGDASVTLIVSGSGQEQYYFSSLANGFVYPAESDFAISIDSINGGTYSGTFSAKLIALDMASGAVADTLNIPDTPFSFTIGGGDDGGDPGNSHTSAPTAAPDDMRKV